jgi:hypothetical protein
VIASRDAILVSDFVNTTGEAVFDGTLKEALTVELQQSPFVNALGTRSVEIAASTSGRPTSPAQTAAAARDLCRRQHLKAIVLGTIAAVEKGYRVTVQAQDCQTGQPIAEGSGEASSKTTVLRALGVATAGLRANLGETPASIQRFSVPVDEATTGSLDALKAYSVGMDTRARVGDAEAIPFFNHAVELDPRFALAEGKLASIYANLHEFQQSQAHTKRAYELSDHVTERERLYIRGSYHLHVTGNLDEAMAPTASGCSSIRKTGCRGRTSVLCTPGRPVRPGVERTECRPDARTRSASTAPADRTDLCVDGSVRRRDCDGYRRAIARPGQRGVSCVTGLARAGQRRC